MVKVCLQVLFVVFTTNLFGQEIGYNEKFLVGSLDNTTPREFSVAGLTGGGFVICRSKYDKDGSEDNIYANIYDKYGKRKHDEFIVNTFKNWNQSYPSVAGLPNGGFVVCWTSLSQEDTWTEGVYAQVYDSSGNRRGEEIHVNTNITGSQSMPCVSVFSSGGFIVCWQSYSQDGSGFGIYAQRFNNNGEKTGNEFRINSNTYGNQSYPSITSMSNNNFVVCWQSEYQDGSLFGIYAQQFDINGLKIGNEFKVNTYTSGDQVYPKISSLTNDAYVICWSSSGQEGSNHRIHAQLYDSTGIKLGDEFLVSSKPVSGQIYPSVTRLTNGGFVICWRGENQGRYDVEMFAQVFNGKGEKLGDEFLVSSNLPYFARQTSVACLENDRFIFCWNSISQSNGIMEFYGKYYLNNPIEHELTEFELLEPKLDSSLKDINPIFKWTHATETHINFPWELTYDLYIDTDFNFSNPILIPNIAYTTFQVDSLTTGKTYIWKVLARNYVGDSLWSSDVNGFYLLTDLNESSEQIAQNFELSQNFPNPFNPTTSISYEIPVAGFVSLKIYNSLGEEVASIVNDYQSGGNHTVEFNADNLSSGVYFYKLQMDKYQMAKKMILIK